MVRSSLQYAAALCLAVLASNTCAWIPASGGEPAGASADIGVDIAGLTPVVDNPFVAFGTLKSAVYAGKERDPDTGRTIRIRLELSVRDTAVTLAGAKVTVVDVIDFEGDEPVGRSRDYYAQHRSGDVYHLAEHVDDLQDGTVVGHEGQWVAGENGSRAGLFMPAAPKVGDVFEQERAPGVAENRSKVVAAGRTLKVPAGTFKDCIETEDYDAIGKSTQRKCYCPGVGLVKESSAERTVELVKRVGR